MGAETWAVQFSMLDLHMMSVLKNTKTYFQYVCEGRIKWCHPCHSAVSKKMNDEWNEAEVGSLRKDAFRVSPP